MKISKLFGPIALSICLVSSVSFANTAKLSASCEAKIRALGAQMLPPDEAADPSEVQIGEVIVSKSHLDGRSDETFSFYKVEVQIPNILSGTVHAEDIRHGCSITYVNLQ